MCCGSQTSQTRGPGSKIIILSSYPFKSGYFFSACFFQVLSPVFEIMRKVIVVDVPNEACALIRQSLLVSDAFIEILPGPDLKDRLPAAAPGGEILVVFYSASPLYSCPVMVGEIAAKRSPALKIAVITSNPRALEHLYYRECGADHVWVWPADQTTARQWLAGSISDQAGKPTRIKFWGVRGSIPVPGIDTVWSGGNTSCVEVRTGSEIVILDAGTGIRPLGKCLQKEFGTRPMDLTILITHTHWDHIQGLPFFIPAYNRVNKVRILGLEGAKRGLESSLSEQMESPFFPITLHELPGNLCVEELDHLEFTVGSIQIRAQMLNHPGICTGYRLNTGGGSVAFLPDFELVHSFTSKNKRKVEHAQLGPNPDQDVIGFLSGTDILILDSQYTVEEYETKIGWGHSCLLDSVSLAAAAGVGKLFLFHHDPDHNDAQIARMEEDARNFARAHGFNLEIEAAREGREIFL